MTGNNQTRNAVLAIVGAIVFLGVALAVAITLRGPSPGEIKGQQETLRSQLVWGCTYEGNPLREVVQSLIREEIHRARKIKPSYFPSIPPAVLHRLIHAQIVQQRHRLKRAAPVSCEGIYPPIP